MAITYGLNVIVMTAANDSEGRGQSGNFDHPLFVKNIKVDTGNGGDVLIEDATTSGQRLVKLDNTTANITINVPIDAFVRGVDATTLPTNATLEIHLGTPGA